MKCFNPPGYCGCCTNTYPVYMIAGPSMNLVPVWFFEKQQRYYNEHIPRSVYTNGCKMLSSTGCILKAYRSPICITYFCSEFYKEFKYLYGGNKKEEFKRLMSCALVLLQDLLIDPQKVLREKAFVLIDGLRDMRHKICGEVKEIVNLR